MAGKSADNQLVSFSVQLDCEAIRPGQEVKGNFCMEILCNTLEASSLSVNILGLEKTEVRWTTSHDTSKSEMHSSKGLNKFLKVEFPLPIPEGRFVRGRYKFPFNATIPAEMPPTMKCHWPVDNGGECEVYYCCEIRLRAAGVKRDICGERRFIVIPKAEAPTQRPATVAPMKEKVTGCCCFPRGDLWLGAYSDKAVLAAGERFDVCFAVENNSAAEIQSINVQVLELVSWEASNRMVRSYEKEIFERTFPALEFSNPELLPLTKRGKSIRDVPADVTMTRMIREALEGRKFVCDAQISENAFAHYHGQLIRISHILRVRCKTPFGTNNPVVDNLLVIHRNGDARRATASVAESDIQVEMPSSLESASSSRSGQYVAVPTGSYYND